MQIELPEFKERVLLDQVQSGDFLYELEELRFTGPRGGRKRVYGMRIASEVIEFDKRTGECLFASDLHARFIYPAQTAIIKRRSA